MDEERHKYKNITSHSYNITVVFECVIKKHKVFE